MAVYADELDECFLVPIALIAGRSSIYLRVERPNNGQRAALDWAAEYAFPGAIAQLGERSAGSRKVVGSSPTSSTHPDLGDGSAHLVGAHEFRNRFGYFMELAAAGRDITVTRRGKAAVRLTTALERPLAPVDERLRRDTLPRPEERGVDVRCRP